MLAYKTFYCCLAGVLTVGIGLLAAVLRAAPAWPVAFALVLAVLAVRLAVRVVHGAELFGSWREQIKRSAIRWITAAAASFVAAVIVLEIVGAQWWVAWVTGVGALTLAQIGTAHVLELLWFRLKPRVPRSDAAPGTDLAVRAEGEVAPDRERSVVRARTWDQMSHDEKIMMVVLEDAGYGWVVLVGYEEIRDGGRAFGAAFLVRVPAARLISEGMDKARISPDAAEPIAIALSERLGVELESRFVAIRKQAAAGLYLVTVVTEDVMARLYAYRDPAVRQSIKEPALAGYGIDTKPVYLLLAQHGQHIGKTRSGKTSLVHALLAYMTSCSGHGDNRDAIVWIGGTEKVYDLVGSWLECYMGTDEALPFDWVARGPVDTLDMMIALMMIARYRQSVPMDQRCWPTIILVLDEASFALRNKTVTGIYDGQEVVMSDMGGMIGQGAGSGDCWAHWATQRDTNDQLGDKGGDMTAQAGFTSAFRIKDNATIGRLMGDYKLPMPKNAGEYWLDDGDGSDPQLVKAPYLQEVDPTKPHLHDQATIADIAWSRRHYPRVLDAGSAHAAGAAYARRHTRMTPELLAYLTGGAAHMSGGATSAARPATDSPRSDTAPADAPTGAHRRRDALPTDEVIEMARDAGIEVDDMSRHERAGFAEAISSEFDTLDAFAAFLANPQGYGAPVQEAAGESEVPAQAAPSGTTSAAPTTTRRVRIVAILTEADAPLRSAEIIDALRAGGDTVTSQEAVYNELSRMVARDALTKSGDGRYGLPDRAYEMADETTVGDSA